MSGTFRLALVTGATGGLGRALSHLLAKNKIPLLLTATHEETLRELAKSLEQETTVEYHAADLSSPSSREELLGIIRSRMPDLVLNNAGIGLYGESLSHPTACHTEVVLINAIAAMELTLEAARALIAKSQKGTILNVSSAAGFFSIPCFASYSASKAFITNFSRAFAREVAPHGIRVLVSCPGQIDTPFRIRASGGRYNKKNGHVISVEDAAREIYHQILHGPSNLSIDRFYRLMLAISRLLPSSLIEKTLMRSIRKRVI